MINIAVIYFVTNFPFDIFFFFYSLFSIFPRPETNGRVFRILSPIRDKVDPFRRRTSGKDNRIKRRSKRFRSLFIFEEGRNVAAQFHVSASSWHES